jgi:hypothetical protein
MVIKRLKPSQKLRIIISGVGIWTTARQVRSGIGCFTKQVAATQKALDALEGMRSGEGTAEQCAIGLNGTWEGLQVQLDIL